MDLASTVQRQREYFLSGATRSLSFRQRQLENLRRALEAHEELLMAALHADLRKSSYQAYATELGMVLAEADSARRSLPKWVKPRKRRAPLIAWPARALEQAEPYGVACIIGPWNYPLQLLLLPLVGAIAAGNCAVLKPSEFAPSTAQAIAELVRRHFEEKYIAVVQGGQDVAERLLREQFDTIFFTGSSKVGRQVMAAAAKHLTPVTLELGGKSPCVVCEDAPVEVTARRIAWGKFMNAGQTCVAPDFVLAHRSIAPALVEQLGRTLQEFYGQDPQRSPEYGRIINRKHLDRLTTYLSAGTVAAGGRSDPADLYLAPTILTHVPAEAAVMQEEIFGPILPVVEFNDLEEALGLVRSRPPALALYLFTRDPRVEAKVLAETRSGGVCLNDTVTHMVGNQLPFGGLGESGLGAYHGRASFDAFSHRRSVLRRSLLLDPPLRYPPARISLRTLKRAYRYLLG